jgi:hypothetical protein
MTFRQFSVLFVRLQALWLLFYAVVELTYLPTYWSQFYGNPSYSELNPELRRNLAMAILRILLQVAAAVALVQYADRVVSWFVRDWIPKHPPCLR